MPFQSRSDLIASHALRRKRSQVGQAIFASRHEDIFISHGEELGEERRKNILNRGGVQVGSRRRRRCSTVTFSNAINPEEITNDPGWQATAAAYGFRFTSVKGKTYLFIHIFPCPFHPKKTFATYMSRKKFKAKN